jgi:hypothetical protein
MFHFQGGRNMELGIPKNRSSNLKVVKLDWNTQPDNKEDRTQTLRDEMDEEGFPTIFDVKTLEVKMFLRVCQFYTARCIWEVGSGILQDPLMYLLGFQFLDWYENLPITSPYLNKENQLCYHIWKSIFEKEYDLAHLVLITELEGLQDRINESQKEYRHLTFRHYRSECKRGTFLNYIQTNLVSRRKIRRDSQPRPSHFKRSSDHSSSSSRVSSASFTTPKVKNFSSEEIQILMSLTPKERKLALSG